jgi:hypothetical protein
VHLIKAHAADSLGEALVLCEWKVKISGPLNTEFVPRTTFLIAFEKNEIPVF